MVELRTESPPKYTAEADPELGVVEDSIGESQLLPTYSLREKKKVFFHNGNGKSLEIYEAKIGKTRLLRLYTIRSFVN
jgi:hypothetical protein